MRLLTLVALYRRIALVSWQTFAYHRAHRQRVQHLAVRVHAARFRHIARVNAFALYARRLRWTLTVRHAAIVAQHATLQRVVFERWRASTLRPMLVHLALLVLGAHCLQLARITALAVDARLVQRAVRIPAAADQFACHLRIALVARHTLTHGTMVHADTLRLRAAAFHRAGRYALSVVARVLPRAVAIGSALDLDALRLRITVVALGARADRFVVLHATLRVRATVARVAADAVDAGRVARAVRVGDAARLHNRLASTATAAYVAVRTGAQHCAHR